MTGSVGWILKSLDGMPNSAFKIADSFSSFFDAVVAFFEAVGSVGPAALATALVLHLVGMVLRSFAWRNIIKAGLGGARTPLAPVAGSLLAGVGLNGVLPARGGDVFKVFLVHKRLPHTTYPMLTSTLVAETLFNAVMGLTLLIWAWFTGRLPSAPDLPGISAFEISWAAQHPAQAAGIVILLATLLSSVVLKHRAAVNKRWHEVRDGIQILRSPKAYALSVLTYQAAAWVVQVATAWFFLKAFSIQPTVPKALLVVLIQGMGSVLIMTPGGVGPKQALTVVLFAGEAPRSTILAFSAGMEVIVVAFQLVVGLLAAAMILDGFRIREAWHRAREEHKDANKSPNPVL